MRFSAACALLLTALLAAPMAQAKDSPPEELAMTGKWVMGYEPTFCALSGDFGEGDARVTLQLIRYSPGDSFELKLYGERFRTKRLFRAVDIDFNSDGTFIRSYPLLGTAGNIPVVFAGTRYLVEGEPPLTITPETEAAVTSLTIRVVGRTTFKLSLPSMGPAMRALRDCTTDLVRQWGFDPAEQSRLASRPSPKNSQHLWLTPSDYPNRSLFEGESAIVRYRLNVDENGNPTACEVQRRTNSPEFAEITCSRLMQRARFLPAISNSGKPVAAYFVGTVTWLVP